MADPPCSGHSAPILPQLALWNFGTQLQVRVPVLISCFLPLTCSKDASAGRSQSPPVSSPLGTARITPLLAWGDPARVRGRGQTAAAGWLDLRPPSKQFLGEVWVNERGERLLRPLTPSRSWL